MAQKGAKNRIAIFFPIGKGLFILDCPVLYCRGSWPPNGSVGLDTPFGKKRGAIYFGKALAKNPIGPVQGGQFVVLDSRLFIG